MRLSWPIVMLAFSAAGAQAAAQAVSAPIGEFTQQALQVGADFFLYKHSPAFLTELLFCIKEGIDKRDWQLDFVRAEIRHRLLVDSLGDVFYELDAEGRFVIISPNLSGLLGYQPEELLGRSYHVLLSVAQQELARFRFNERRTGARAVTGFELTLQGKPTTDGRINLVPTEISARGRYDPSRRFMGTVGNIRDVSERKKQQTTIQALQQQLHRTDELRALAEQITSLSRDLQQPLATLLRESKQLSDALSEVHITDRLAALTGHAVTSAQLGERLVHLIQEASQGSAGFTINHLIADLLESSYPQQEGTRGVRTDFATSLPDYHGDRERTAGGHRRFHRSEVEKFLESSRGSAAKAFVDLLLQSDGLGVEARLLTERSRLGSWLAVVEMLGEGR